MRNLCTKCYLLNKFESACVSLEASDHTVLWPLLYLTLYLVNSILRHYLIYHLTLFLLVCPYGIVSKNFDFNLKMDHKKISYE